MTAITFDTLSTSRRLREKGLSQQQAEAIADELRMASEVDVSHLATQAEVSAFKSELKADLRELELRLESRMAEHKADMIKWMFGGFLTVIGILVAILLKMP